MCRIRCRISKASSSFRWFYKMKNRNIHYLGWMQAHHTRRAQTLSAKVLANDHVCYDTTGCFTYESDKTHSHKCLLCAYQIIEKQNVIECWNWMTAYSMRIKCTMLCINVLCVYVCLWYVWATFVLI